MNDGRSPPKALKFLATKENRPSPARHVWTCEWPPCHLNWRFIWWIYISVADMIFKTPFLHIPFSKKNTPPTWLYHINFPAEITLKRTCLQGYRVTNPSISHVIRVGSPEFTLSKCAKLRRHSSASTCCRDKVLKASGCSTWWCREAKEAAFTLINV